jgi:hypothetical protein
VHVGGSQHSIVLHDLQFGNDVPIAAIYEQDVQSSTGCVLLLVDIDKPLFDLAWTVPDQILKSRLGYINFLAWPSC